MRRTIWFTVILLIGLASRTWPSQPRADEQTDTRRTALQPVSFRPLPLGQVKPSGWLREQLETQAAGLSGHLDEFWPDIKNSAWIGGNAEGWERVPYWLDGIVPLAYLLDDQALQARIKPFIDSILDHQQPDGWLGPVGDTAGRQPHDVWPLFPLFKALTQYQEATGDPRVVPALLRCAREIDQVIDQKPLYSWAKVRAADFARQHGLALCQDRRDLAARACSEGLHSDYGSAADGRLSLHIRGGSSDRQGQGAAFGRLEDRQRGGRSAAVEPGEKRRPTRGVDPDPLRMHRPADHRVPDAGTALTIEDERSFPVRAGRAYHVSGPRAS